MTIKELKGPKTLPVLGNAHQIELDQLHLQVEEWSKEFGDQFRLNLGPKKVIVVTDPGLIHGILKQRPDKFRRMAKMDNVLRESGFNGVFNEEGETWKIHRKLVAKGLDVKHQVAFFEQMLAVVERFKKKLDRAAKSDQAYDIQKDLIRFTVDVTTILAFGYDMNTLEQEGHVIQDHLEVVFPTIFKRINAPIAWRKYWKTKSDKAFDASLDEIIKWIEVFIDDTRKRFEQDPSLKNDPKNILESLLVEAEQSDQLNDKDVIGNLLTILLAGEDTTAHSIAWLIYQLSGRDELISELQDEVQSVLGEDRWLTTFQSQHELPLLDATVKESMRLKPVAPLLLVSALEHIQVGEFIFEEGQAILINSRKGARDERHFQQAEEFNPKRWMENTGKCPVHNPDATIPFGSGARYCPGMNLAMTEIRMVMSMILRNYEFELVTPKEEVYEIMSFTMMPSKFKVLLKPRIET